VVATGLSAQVWRVVGLLAQRQLAAQTAGLHPSYLKSTALSEGTDAGLVGSIGRVEAPVGLARQVAWRVRARGTPLAEVGGSSSLGTWPAL
jgi:hypothetical protein